VERKAGGRRGEEDMQEVRRITIAMMCEFCDDQREADKNR
jgi:hypothetical protein